ncbi:MAG: helix-turn-helix transcriptional regulator [Bacteroidetes bacterium]|nr:helix-turn-helix transcriptional regulator [Bacteroidota bacterium]
MDKKFQKEIILIGREIKRLREVASLTQQDVAIMAGVDIRTIQRIEKGEHGMGVPVLIGIAEALGVCVGDILRVIGHG